MKLKKSNIGKTPAHKVVPAEVNVTILSSAGEALAAPQTRKPIVGTKTLKKSVVAKEPVVEAQPAQEEAVTTVAARIDVGFGNTLFIRGQGDGLSWDCGTPLQCVDAGTWIWKTTGVKAKAVFKLLLNDQVWAQGEDLTVEAGERVEVVPVF